MKNRYSLTERFIFEQKSIRDDIQCLLDQMAEKLNNRVEDSDNGVGEILSQVTVLTSRARGLSMRLKECKRLHALVEYMIDEKQITQNTYASASNDDRSNKKQAR